MHDCVPVLPRINVVTPRNIANDLLRKLMIETLIDYFLGGSAPAPNTLNDFDSGRLMIAVAG